MITLRFDRQQLGRATASLGRLSKAIWDMTETMDAIGAYMVSSTQRRFQVQAGPDGVPWPQSLRSKIQSGGKTTLLESGTHLRDRITHLAGRDTVEVGLNTSWAHVHQLGATISAKNGPNLTFRLANGRWVSKPSVTIPARPFLGIDQRDEEEIDAIVVEDLERAERGSA